MLPTRCAKPRLVIRVSHPAKRGSDIAGLAVMPTTQSTSQPGGWSGHPCRIPNGTRVPSLPSSRTPPCPLLPPIGFFSPVAISALTPSLPPVSSVSPSLLPQSPQLPSSIAERVNSYLLQGQKTQFTMATNGSTYALSQGHKDASLPRQRGVRRLSPGVANRSIVAREVFDRL